MKRSLLLFISISIILLAGIQQNGFGQTYHTLSAGSFSQNWTNTGIITANDDWSGVASITGFLGDDASTTTAGTDPQTILAAFTTPDVMANLPNASSTTGGVGEFELTDPTIGFQGSGTADYPHIILYINTTNCTGISIRYDLRDIDGSVDNAVQPVALQYRLGSSGNFTNIPAGFVADASTGPNLATLVTPVSLMLPAECNNQSEVQIRIITSNASGSDEWIGIDNIVVEVDVTAPIPSFIPSNSSVNVPTNAAPTITFDEPVRKTDGTELVNADLASLVTFRKTDGAGADVPFSAVIDAAKRVITITPSALLDNSQLYYLSAGPVEDGSGNESTAKNITFTTISAAGPSITLTFPIGGEVMYANSAQTISWTSANITNVFIEVWVLEGDTRTWQWIPFISSTPAATGKIDIIVPADALYGNQYKVRVSDLANPTVSSTGSSFTIIAVATSLTNLKQYCVIDDIVRINADATVTFIRSQNRSQKYIQDAGAGLLIDDPAAVLTTTVALGDNISGLEGRLGAYGGVLQIVPTVATVNVTSSGNSVSIPSMTVAQYNTNYFQYESMLVKISGVTFPDANGTAVFATTPSSPIYSVTDGTNSVAFYTFKTGEGNIVGSVIPAGNHNVTALGLHFNTTPEIASRTTSDFEFLTAIEKTSATAAVIYPVPARDVLMVRNVSNVRSAEILDATGKLIRSSNISGDDEINIPVSDLKQGFYFLRLTTTDGKVIKKFVK